MQWFDIGVNLTSPRLSDNIDSILMRAKEVGVHKIAITGTDEEESRQAALLAQRHPNSLYFTAGVHPHYAKDVSVDYIDTIRSLATEYGAIAIGECGLDFNRDFSPRAKQLAVFESQLELACELKLPVFLHERDAFDQQVKLLEQYRPSLVGGVAHCFTGNIEQLKAYVELDFHIGITGWLCDPKRGTNLREAIEHLPLEKLLFETDAPYLIPKTIKPRPKQNEPCYLVDIATEFSSLTNHSLGTLAKYSHSNSLSLFNLLESAETN